jgi:hypothetical protein
LRDRVLVEHFEACEGVPGLAASGSLVGDVAREVDLGVLHVAAGEVMPSRSASSGPSFDLTRLIAHTSRFTAE